MRERNLSTNGYERLGHETIAFDNLLDCWKECKSFAKFEDQQLAIAEFNRHDCSLFL